MSYTAVYILGAIPFFLVFFVWFSVNHMKRDVDIGTFLVMAFVSCIPVLREVCVIMFMYETGLITNFVLFKAKRDH